ncbi:MAG: hypothetical protein ACN6O3_00410 [Comamonas sp.]
MISTQSANPQYSKYIYLSLTFALGAILQGAIPFLSLTTLGQAVVVVGYPISFINDGGLTLYATNMGYPSLAPMSTMLAPGLVMELFLLCGFTAQNAFTASFILWYSLGYWGAYKLARTNGVKTEISALLALLWMAFPIVWNSSRYSHLHFGLVLLPFLFFSCIKAIDSIKSKNFQALLLYPLTALLAVFTDGYTFMFFAIGSSIILLHQVWAMKEIRIGIIKKILPLHAFSFAIAYTAYAVYIGKTAYNPAPLDFFRGWGVDLLFLAQPSLGVHWLWDTLGLSTSRTEAHLFGDESVWISSFCLPLIIAGGIAYWKSRKTFVFAGAMLLLAIFGAYMALGPSIKLDATRAAELGRSMPAELALGSTGNAFLSEYIPGFKSMRASYRWIALCFFGLWGLLVGYFYITRHKNHAINKLLLVILIVLFIPNISTHTQEKINNYIGFSGIDDDLVQELKKDVIPGEIVAFLPWNNDFIMNYLAPKLDIKSYNVGGDKNVDTAYKKWPPSLRLLSANSWNDQYSLNTLLFLATENVDAVIFPYFDMLEAAHAWPSPPIYQERVTQVFQELEDSGYVTVINKNNYSVARLKSEFSSSIAKKALAKDIASKYCLSPICIRASGFTTETPKQVGTVIDGKLASNGLSGFLHFGPYAPLQAGDYVLHIFGTVANASEVWVDVVSRKGSVNHGKFMIKQPTGFQENLLIAAPIHLPQPVNDIEVRMYVGAESKIVLNSYELRPASKDTQP